MISAFLVTKRLPKMFSTARVLPPSGTVKAFVVGEDCAAVVGEGLSVVAFVVFFFCGLMIGGILMSGNLATGLRNGGRRFGFFVVLSVVAVVLAVVVVRGRKLHI